jgi:BirA family transcriptional regulator, biotin operon repressor / biotin---[acetyl-CoA-carboxylase] ligase
MELAMRVLQSLTAARAAEGKARRFVSGAVLATQCKVTRSAIWKAVRQLRDWGCEIEAVTHQGYRLAQPASPLTLAGVTEQLSPAMRRLVHKGQCLGLTTSTNSLLLERGAPPAGHFEFITAEHQSAGRGRRGRVWLAPPGGAICLSWSWCFDALPPQMSAFSLAIGVATLRALASAGIQGVQLKWPNDLVTATGKLGGILIEMRTEAAGPVHVVIGLGLNFALGKRVRERIDATGNTPADICSLLPEGVAVKRNVLTAALLEAGVEAAQQFAQDGFRPFRVAYRAADALQGRSISVQGSGPGSIGIARGVDDDGALLVEQANQIHRVIAGEVSIRSTRP